MHGKHSVATMIKTLQGDTLCKADMITFNHLIAANPNVVCSGLCSCCFSPGLSMFNAT